LVHSLDMKSCRKCNTPLILEENWTKASKDNRCYMCKDCIKKQSKQWRKDNKERKLLENREWNKKNKDKRNSYSKNWRKNNKDIVKKYNKKWNNTNLKVRNAHTAKRRAEKLKRTPKYADLEGIKFFYAMCPKGYEVDHIIPLQGKIVSGFHILNNLQYLTPTENRKKSNKFKSAT